MPEPYQPPFTLSSTMLRQVAEIAAMVGRLGALAAPGRVPRLRHENRIRSIHSSLAIENNTLTLAQVSAVIEGKRVLGPPREIHEVRNAFAAYENLATWSPSSVKNLLAAHRLLMQGLVDGAGHFRTRPVGIAQGKHIVHLAPPADRVLGLMKDLLAWLRRTDSHPLIASCVFHYELEFIHPFEDGNGRIGRLWQTLILSRWQPLFEYLPVESVIRREQPAYYEVLATCDNAGNSSAFVEFMLSAILAALRETSGTEPDTEQVTEQVARLLKALGDGDHAAGALMPALALVHRPTFLYSYLQPALAAGLIARTLPDKPTSRLQKYRLTPQGRAWIARHAPIATD